MLMRQQFPPAAKHFEPQSVYLPGTLPRPQWLDRVYVVGSERLAEHTNGYGNCDIMLVPHFSALAPLTVKPYHQTVLCQCLCCI